MKTKIEAELQDRIIKWASFMRWRPDYEKWVEGRIWQENYGRAQIKDLQGVVGDLSGKKILDLGSGMGGFSVALKQAGIDVVAVDFNSDYCKITKLRGERYNLNVSPINGMGEYLPFKNEQFDLVCLFDVLEHVEKPKAVLREVYGVLKPGGQVLLTLINRYAFRDPHYHLYFINWMPKGIAEKYIRIRGRSKESSPCQDSQKLSDLHYFTFSKFHRLAKSVGFQCRDLLESKLREGNIKTPKLSLLVKILSLLKMEIIAYRLLRFFYFRGFNVLLTKHDKAIGLRKLDIGCGRSKREGFIGIDINRDSNADIIASALEIPVEDSTIEEINCSHLVEHLYPNQAKKLFDEFYRVLKDGGTAKLKIDRDWTKTKLLRKDPEHKHRYLEKEIKEMVKDFTYKNVEKRMYRFGYRVRNKIFVELRK